MAEKNVFQNFAGAPIWKHFKRSLCGKLAQCNLCRKQLKCEGGSIKGLHIHLRRIHKIDLSKRTDTKKTSAEVSNSEVFISNAIRKLDIYMNDSSLSAVLARMTACDGLSFNIFTTSPDLRKSLTALGHSLPKSVVGIRDQVLRYGSQLREKVSSYLSNIKSKGGYFIVIFQWIAASCYFEFINNVAIIMSNTYIVF